MSPIRRSFALAKVLCIAVAALAMFFVLPTSVTTKHLTTREANATPPDGNPNGNDPCNHLPDPPGKAIGIDKKCGVKGSSGGVAKGDFNGDGIGDLAIGIPDEDLSGQVDAGAVVVIYGSAANGLIPAGAAGIPASQFWSQDSTGILDIAEAGDHFGAALAAGDFNHDGFSDLAIGVPGENTAGGTGAGAVNIIYGSASGLTATGNQFIANPFNFPAGDAFGSSLVWGFFNADSFGDLAIGIPNRDVPTKLALPGSPGTTAVDAGAIAVYFGASGHLSTSGFQYIQQNTNIPFDAPNNFGDFAETNDHFGKVMTAGDFNGDNISDLAVGMPDEELGPANIRDSGAVHIIYGSATGLTKTGAQLINQDTPGVLDSAELDDHFGAAVAAGDFNNDTFVDLAVGVPDEDLNGIKDAGGVNIIYGSATGLNPTITPQFWNQTNGSIPSEGGAETGDHFGAALAANFLNGDGFRDLAIGVPGESVICATTSQASECVNAIGLNSITDAGAVNVIYGSATGLSASASATRPAAQIWHQDTPGIAGEAEAFEHFGAVLTSWDFGRSSAGDLAIGVPSEIVLNSSGNPVFEAGGVNVIYGVASGGGLGTSGNQLFTEETAGVPGVAQSSAHFGGAVY